MSCAAAVLATSATATTVDAMAIEARDLRPFNTARCASSHQAPGRHVRAVQPGDVGVARGARLERIEETVRRGCVERDGRGRAGSNRSDGRVAGKAYRGGTTRRQHRVGRRGVRALDLETMGCRTLVRQGERDLG